MSETRARDLANVGVDATQLATDADLSSGLASKADATDLATKLNKSSPTFTGTLSGPNVAIDRPSDLWTANCLVIDDLGGIYTPGSYRISLVSNGYRNSSNQWTSYGAGGSTGAAEIQVEPSGRILFNAERSKANGSAYTIENQATLEEGRFKTPVVYNLTSAAAANVFIETLSGSETYQVLKRSTSSIKYKTDVETLQNAFADKILAMRPVWFRSTANGDADHSEWSHYGLIAEEVAAIEPRLVTFTENDDGSLEPEGVQYDRIVPHLINLVQRQQAQIQALTDRLDAAGI